MSSMSDGYWNASVTTAHKQWAPPERTCTVVAEQHRRWWEGVSLGLPPENVLGEPCHCDTAEGILLPLLQIVHRDPQATLLVLPSDHCARREDVLATALRNAVVQLERQPRKILLLGLTPEYANPEFDYIVAEGDDIFEPRAIALFVEKPSVSTARALIERGAMWNSFIVAANAQALLRLFNARCPAVVNAMRCIVEQALREVRSAHLAELREPLPRLDLYRDILHGAGSALGVLKVPACGWSAPGAA